MRSVPFEFNGRTYELAFTAEALFRCMEQYGGDVNVVASTKCAENTLEGLKGACWLGALLASQGELQRRYRGEDPLPMLTAEELRRSAGPGDLLALRDAIQRAVALGLRRSVSDEDEDAEVDAVLAERSAAEKKTEILAAYVLNGLRRAAGLWDSLSGKSDSSAPAP